MSSRIWWTAIPSGDGRVFVYSPRIGSTYLLDAELMEGAFLPALLGLDRRQFKASLNDPANAVLLTGAFEKERSADLAPPVRVGRWLPALYVFFHRSRSIVTFGAALRLAAWISRARKKRIMPEEIGSTVWAVERKLGFSDCYPRALVSACLAHGLDCQIVIGILAPTSKLHAWCSIDGAIPYEPVPRHWWYNPLVIARVA